MRRVDTAKGKKGAPSSAMDRLKRMMGFDARPGEVLSKVEAKTCPELDSKVVGSVCRGVDRILKDYSKGKKIGEGAFSEVFIVKFKQSGKMFADKLVSKLSDAYDHPSLEKEIQIMKMIDHPNCMRLFAVYDEPTMAHLVLELVRGSNMLDRLDKMEHNGVKYSETEAAKVLEGCLSGLRCIHSMRITHRDLKPGGE